MEDAAYNPNDPAFLLSRSLDEQLSEAEQGIVDAWLTASPERQAEADQLRRLDQLVKRVGPQEVEVDWDAQLEHVLHAIAEPHDGAVEEEADLEAADRLVARWAGDPPEIEWDEFTTGVMERIAPLRRQVLPVGWLIRIAAPLAAAAAIIFAITATFHAQPVMQVTYVVGVSQTLVVESDLEMTPSSSVSVVFGRSGQQEETSGVSYMSVGAAPIATPTVEAMPL